MSSDDSELRVAWRAHVGDSPTADSWFDSVIALHRAPSRQYHGVRHVVWVVRHGRELAAATEPPVTDELVDRIVAAAFFHDAIYDAARTDNEPASARLAARALAEIGWRAEAVDHVRAMIEATARHPVDTASDPATQVLVAADLAVLATEPSKYGDYTRAVRREYAHLDDAAWRRGRAAFIRTTLGRDAIFPTALELTTWERRARANLTAELAALE